MLTCACRLKCNLYNLMIERCSAKKLSFNKAASMAHYNALLVVNTFLFWFNEIIPGNIVVSLAVQSAPSSNMFYSLAFVSGDLIEKGVMRRLPDGFDGNTCPYIFTWSTERPNKVKFFLSFSIKPYCDWRGYYTTICHLNFSLTACPYYVRNEGLGNGLGVLPVLQHLQGGHRQYTNGPILRWRQIRNLRHSRHWKRRGASSHLHFLEVAHLLFWLEWDCA